MSTLTTISTASAVKAKRRQVDNVEFVEVQDDAKESFHRTERLYDLGRS